MHRFQKEALKKAHAFAALSEGVEEAEAMVGAFNLAVAVGKCMAARLSPPARAVNYCRDPGPASGVVLATVAIIAPMESGLKHLHTGCSEHGPVATWLASAVQTRHCGELAYIAVRDLTGFPVGPAVAALKTGLDGLDSWVQSPVVWNWFARNADQVIDVITELEVEVTPDFQEGRWWLDGSLRRAVNALPASNGH